jgi:serine protease Do
MDNWNNFNSNSGSGNQSDGNNRVEHTDSGLEYEHIEPNFIIRDYSEDEASPKAPQDTASRQEPPQNDMFADSSSYGYEQSSSPSYSDSYSGYGDPGFGGGNNGGGNGGSYYGSGAGPEPQRGGRVKKEKIPMQITRKAFVLILIICMLATSALTVGGMYVYGNYFASGSNSATNYTLSKSTETLSYKSIISKAQDSVVSITTESVSTDSWAQNYVTEGAGSGVIIQSNGYIVTCNHVISGASKITVTLNNKKNYTAKVIGTDSENDVAVLKINATGLTAATYGDSSKLQVGDSVVAIGNPLGELSNTATTGIISALNRNLTIEGQSMNLLQTDASINPGNSGGALFNSSGNLIGIVVAKSTGSDVEGLGFAIPINKVAKVAKNLIKNGSSSSSLPWLLCL